MVGVVAPSFREALVWCGGLTLFRGHERLDALRRVPDQALTELDWLKQTIAGEATYGAGCHLKGTGDLVCGQQRPA
jgi:hypothetical protein